MNLRNFVSDVLGKQPLTGDLGPSGPSSPQAVNDLLENGISAMATIVSIRETGTWINDNPQVTVVAQLAPEDDIAPYEAEATLVMSLADPIQVGARFPALIYPEDLRRFGLIVDFTDLENVPMRVLHLAMELTATADFGELDDFGDLDELERSALSAMSGPSPEAVDDLVENGIPAVATILSIRETGTWINSSPQVNLRARLEPVDGNPYEAEKTLVMSLVNPIRVGARIPALIYPEDHGKFGLIVDITDTSQFPPRLRDLVDQLSVPADDFAAQLERVHGLHRSGALSDVEFAEAKARILRN
jgi:hypothetical protein